MSNPTPESAPRLTETQRGLAVERLSEDDCAALVVQFAQEAPEQFDAALFSLRSRYEKAGA